MNAEVDFRYIRLGASGAEEPACIGFVAGRLVVILVGSQEDEECREAQQWYLDAGFGPCDRQGLIFSSLDAASVWILDQIAGT